MLLLCALVVGSSAWADPTVLFHETFGNNTGSARAWDDSYSVKSGVSAVYSGITSYTVSNVKQGKNTTGSTQSGLNQSSQGTDAYIIIGPLSVADYKLLGVTYQWKAASINGTYSTKLEYATSSGGSYTEVSGTGKGATTFVERSYSLPEATQVSTLYLKITWNTSNTQAIIDEVELTGIATSGSSSTCATPTFSPAAGTYTSTQNVTISTTTEGATIYYTTDGNDPTTSSSVYSSAISVSSTTTIKAMAVASDYDNSAVATAAYTIVPLEHAGTEADPYTVADARAAIDANTGLANVYAKGIVSKIVTAFDPYHGNISYNISADGLTNSDQLQSYRGMGKGGYSFNSAADIQVGDVVVVYGTLEYKNDTYRFDQGNQLAKIVRKPLFSPEAGVVSSGQTVALSSVEGATIYYTTDGTDPTTSSATYSDPITITAETTIKAFAVNDGLTSETVTAAYTIGTPTATPTISVATGTYTSAQSVTITCETAGATIYYTTDGTDPTTSSTEYTTAITIDESCTLKAIAVASGYAASEVASATYTMQIPALAVSPTTATMFTYNEGKGPSATQTFTLSGEYLTAAITVSVPSDGSFEISSDGTTFSNSISRANGETFVVRMKAGLSTGNYNGTVTISSTGAENVTIDLTGTVAGGYVTWDLTKNSYSSSAAESVSWTSSQATMTLAKGTSSTNANNYLGDSSSHTHTRFYQNQVLTIAPARGYQILSAEITAMSSYVEGFTGNNWTNATTSTSGTSITVTPTNGTQAMSVTISGACHATAVTVYYVKNTTPSIAVNTTLNVTCDETEGTIDVTYNNIAGNSSAEVVLCDSEGNTTTYDWIEVELDNNKDVYYVISANPGAERTGYLKVKVGDVTSDIVTITQAEHVETITYTLATSITSGKHYVIASGTDGDVKVMGAQNYNNSNVPTNRAAVDGSVNETTLSVESNAGATEFVIYGPEMITKNNEQVAVYTIYDETNSVYLYASSSSNNYLATRESNSDENGKWTIVLNDGKAVITAQGTNTRNLMRYNSQNSIFSCYSSNNSQADIYLYEKDGETTPTEDVTLNTSGYATYCSQNALDFTNWENADYSAWAITSVSGTTIIFSQITTQIPSGTGILLKGPATNPGTEITLTSATGAEALTSNLLEGFTTATAVSADNQYYGLSGNQFVKVNAGTVPAGKALLPATEVDNEGGGGNGLARLTFVFEDAQGIKTIEHSPLTIDDSVYNLNGQRVVTPKKGLYIVNGKKVVMK